MRIGGVWTFKHHLGNMGLGCIYTVLVSMISEGVENGIHGILCISFIVLL